MLAAFDVVPSYEQELRRAAAALSGAVWLHLHLWALSGGLTT